MRLKVFFGILLTVLLLGAGILFSFYGRQESPASDQGKLKVLTTFLPLYVFTKNVAGDIARVENLLPQGVGPHDYAFSPSDVIKVAEAEVVVKQGRGFDDWIDKVISASGKKDIRVIVAGDGIEAHTGVPRYDPLSGPVSPPANLTLVRPDPNDPHLWLDPFLAVREVERIRDGLMEADPEHANEYARNAEAFLLRLIDLDTEIRWQLRDLSRREFVAFHSAFRYFAYEYELREAAVIEEIPGREPSPAELARIVEQIQRTGVRVIFSEPQFSPKIVETLIGDYGLRLVEIDTLETGELRPDYYEEVMRENVRKIADALKGD
ncbi:zinc ABC transporter substrate-binding protein [Candidatus Uhrbacteria bacterium]|nr:zinc ABC transporter substrate-binding protein [Candidatus Uhrbacteria bacterium]